ncbi:MAG: RidA family protein [Hyphomicrobiales bacterium]|nr:RidA family protein [Hyphomicrobiales bacterium]
MIEIVQPEGWAKPKGYSNGILATGRSLYVGGQIGWNSQCVFETLDLVAQFRQTLQNVLDVVHTAGGNASHIVQMTWYLTDKAEYASRLKEIGEVYRALMGRHYPAMAAVEVKALVEPEARIEIQAIAVLP